MEDCIYIGVEYKIKEVEPYIAVGHYVRTNAWKDRGADVMFEGIVVSIEKFSFDIWLVGLPPGARRRQLRVLFDNPAAKLTVLYAPKIQRRIPRRSGRNN